MIKSVSPANAYYIENAEFIYSFIEPIWISELRQSLADPNIDRNEISNYEIYLKMAQNCCDRDRAT